MKERASWPMKSWEVRAIIDGRKTQHRIVVKPQPPITTTKIGTWHHPDDDTKGAHFWSWGPDPNNIGQNYIQPDWAVPCPYGQPGDRLWGREAFYEEFGRSPTGEAERMWWMECGYLAYRASDERPYGSGGHLPWRPSIHMPRWASRILLEIVSVRIERLLDISEADALDEGIESLAYGGLTTYRNYSLTDELAEVSPMLESPIESYRTLWESINSPGSWDENPWVWVIEFRRVEA